MATLTATEAADRIKDRRGVPERQHEGSLYSCEQCGSSRFDVVAEMTRETERVETLACDCDKDTEYAAQRTLTVTVNCRRWGQLDEHHDFTFEGEEEDDLDTEEVDYVIECSRCSSADDGSGESWEVEESETKEKTDHFEVRCRNCNHEVEFGWSHPDRGGRIWPVEAVDFNPWKSWPEPRFAEDWKRRRWIPPDRA